jgi:dipeptide transport system ATP-binding protein
VTALVAARDLARVYTAKSGPFATRQELRAVGGVSFDIEAGKTLAIVGESGCGKSTLARLVTMIERPDAGTLTIDGADALSSEARHRLRPVVQFVFQNPYGSLNPRRKVGKILEEPLLINTRLGGAERKRNVLDTMTRVGLSEEQAGRYPHMFSGGQRQRIAIARALMLRPKLVVADEPVSALDVSVQAQVLNLLMDLQQQFGLAYMFISHDLAVVRFIAHDVLVMYLGLAVEHGPKERIFEQPLHPYTQALLASTPGLGGKRPAKRMVKGEVPSPLNVPKGCVFEPRCPHATALCRAERPPLRLVSGRQVACHYAEQFRTNAAADSRNAFGWAHPAL